MRWRCRTSSYRGFAHMTNGHRSPRRCAVSFLLLNSDYLACRHWNMLNIFSRKWFSISWRPLYRPQSPLSRHKYRYKSQGLTRKILRNINMNMFPSPKPDSPFRFPKRTRAKWKKPLCLVDLLPSWGAFNRTYLILIPNKRLCNFSLLLKMETYGGFCTPERVS